MPLRVGIDAWNLTGDRRGIGRYVREIVGWWAQWRSQIDATLLVPDRFAWLARKRYLEELAGVKLPVRHRSAARSMDVLFFPWNGMSWTACVPSVATLFDASLFSLTPYEPEVLERERQPFRLAVERADRIITSSQFSKQELVRHLHLDPSRVDVVRLGVPQRFAQPHARQAPRENSELADRFFLFVGEPEERKGLKTIFEAMSRLPEGVRATTELVIAGATGRYPIPQVPDGVRARNVGWVDDAALAGLYAHATALIYPSIYEGFGLPIVEAMASGTPVIAADVGASREAGGEAAMYVSPGDAEALANAIVRVLEDAALRKRLHELGLSAVEGLRWDETARQTLRVLERTAGLGPNAARREGAEEDSRDIDLPVRRP